MTDSVRIEIYGPTAKISGPFPRSAVRLTTSYPVEGAKFAQSYRKGMWDGRKHLFRSTSDTFPSGLTSLVKEACEFAGNQVEIVDHRDILEPRGRTYDLVGVSMTGKYSYQLDAAEKAIKARQGVLRIATNGGKTEVACAITQYLHLSTLFMVTTRELLYQSRERFMKRLGVGEEEVGIIGDGHWEPGTWVTVATVDTIESRIDRPECQDFIKGVEVLFVDECHHLGSETWYEICSLCPANYRYGLSGTPLDRTDGANLRLLGAIGDIIVDIPNKFLVENGISARTSIIFSKVTAPILPKKITYPAAYKQGIVDNPNALNLVVEWVKVFSSLGLGTLVLCEEISHGKAIDELLWTGTDGQFIPHQFIYGEEDTDVRRNALKDFGEGRLPVLVASTILDEGVDVPTIDALILAGSRKSRIKTMQRLGRGLRGKKLIAVEFANFCHDYLLRHGLQRYEDYKKEECFPVYQSGPDVELVKKIWNDSSSD